MAQAANVVHVGTATGSHAAQVARVKGGAKPAAKPAKGGNRSGNSNGGGGGGLAGLVQQEMQAAEAPIQQQIDAERAANLARAQAQMGFAKAAAAIMQSAAPRVQDAYTNAANADAGYARGLGDAAQQPIDQNTQQNNQFLTQMGTPAGALKSAPPVGDIAYGLQGYIPASTLQREGAGWESAAQLFPGDLLQSGQQSASSTLANDPQMVKLQDELGKIAATEPSVYNKLLGLAQTNAYRNAELGLRGQTLKSENAYRNATLGLRAQTLQSENAYRNATLGLRAQSLQISQARLSMEAQKAAQSNAQAWARIGIENKRLRMEIAKQDMTARAGGLTPTERSRYTAIAQSWAQRILGPTTDPTTGKVMPQMTVKDAVTEALKSGVPLSIAVPQVLSTLKGHISPAEENQIRKEYGGLDKSLGRGVARIGQPASPAVGGGGSFLAPFDLPQGLSGIKNAVHRAAATQIVRLAHEYLGTPYVWGGESPGGFDCSGFAQYLYAKVGVAIPRTTYTQWTDPGGKVINPRQLQPGDLVFYKGSDSRVQGGRLLPGHVAIYIGGGKVIDAFGTGYGVRVDDINSPTLGGYMGARRFGKA